MAVEGPTGLRCMTWKDGKELTSPQQTQFKWSKRIMWAECSCEPTYHLSEEEAKAHKRLTPPYDPEDFPDWPRKILLMDADRNCGLWASTGMKVINKHYGVWSRGQVLFMVEALGSIYLYTEGWRASGIEILAVVWPKNFDDPKIGKMSKNEMRFAGAAEYFQVPIIREEMAVRAVEISIEPYFDGGEYDHETAESPYTENQEGMRISSGRGSLHNKRNT